MPPVLEAPESKRVGSWTARPGVSAWLRLTYPVGSQVNPVTPVHLGFPTGRTKRENRSHVAPHFCKPAALLWAQVLMNGEDNLGNKTSCLQPEGTPHLCRIQSPGAQR